MKNTVLTLGSVLLLSACGGSNSANQQVDNIVARAEAISAELETYDFTSESEIEALAIAGGTVSYSGVSLYGDITVESDPEAVTPYLAVGTLTASAEFGKLTTITATATDFVEIEIPAELSNLADLSALEGLDEESLNGLEDLNAAGAIDGEVTFDLGWAFLENDIDAPFDGTMTGSITKLNGETVLLDDQGFGILIGPNGEGIVVGGVQGDGEEGGSLVLGVGTQ